MSALPGFPAKKRSSLTLRRGDGCLDMAHTARLLPERAHMREKWQENQRPPRTQPSTSSLPGIFRVVTVSRSCFSSPEEWYLGSSCVWTIGNWWVVCDAESEVRAGIARCKLFLFRHRRRPDEKQCCWILFLASVLWCCFCCCCLIIWVFFRFELLLSGVTFCQNSLELCVYSVGITWWPSLALVPCGWCILMCCWCDWHSAVVPRYLVQ